jgi:penicillin-binding protein 1A
MKTPTVTVTAARLRRNADKSGAKASLMRKILKWFAVTLAALFLAAFLAVAGSAGWFYWNAAKALPDHRLAAETSSWTGCLPEGSNHQFVPLSAIPENAINAFLAVEDPNFFNRPAFNPVAEFIQALRGMRPRGTGILSGIYAGQLLACQGSEHASFGRHFRAVLLTYRIERDLPKRNILETIINTLYFGRGSFGIAAGAEAHFHKPLSQLSLAEMALLGDAAGHESTTGSFNHERAVLKHRSWVLDRMVGMGAITPQQAEAAKLEPLGVQKRSPVSKEAP